MSARNHAERNAALLACCFLLLAAGMAASVLYGSTNYPWSEAWAAAFHYDPSDTDQIIIRTTRMPRAFIAAVVGASLAVAGALMQTLTRNPLASPGTLGVNAAASFVAVMAAVVLQVASLHALMWLAFVGAGAGAAAVFALGSIGRDGLTPMKMVLAGAAMTALFSSFTQAVLVLNKQGINTVLYWLTGTIAGRDPHMMATVLPYMIAGWAGALIISRELNVLMIGDDAAKGLGQRTALLKAAAVVIVVALAGGSVAVAGPIAFIGVVVPHVARHLSGIDHRWVIPYCAVLGATLLVGADLAARFVMYPEEMPVGVMTALIGVPFFFHIARKGTVRS